MGEGLRKRIIESSIEIFAKKGFHQTKVDEIANNLNIAKGTVYLYFKSKEDLLHAAIEYTFNEMLEFYKPNYDLTFEENLRNILLNNYQHLKTNKELYSLFFTQMYNLRKDIKTYEEKMKFLVDMHRKIFDMIKELLLIAKREGIINDEDDVSNLALLLNYLIEGTMRTLGIYVLGLSYFEKNIKLFSGTPEDFIDYTVKFIKRALTSKRYV